MVKMHLYRCKPFVFLFSHLLSGVVVSFACLCIVQPPYEHNNNKYGFYTMLQYSDFVLGLSGQRPILRTGMSARRKSIKITRDFWWCDSSEAEFRYCQAFVLGTMHFNFWIFESVTHSHGNEWWVANGSKHRQWSWSIATIPSSLILCNTNDGSSEHFRFASKTNKQKKHNSLIRCIQCRK